MHNFNVWMDEYYQIPFPSSRSLVFMITMSVLQSDKVFVSKKRAKDEDEYKRI